ncbi:DMT family transporter [Conservatibacter flavescens]|uniref:EamA family transporter n=1 Tax=Conservatibacter flavescens TaxID=28161 RepID=A0A2M8S137_9PAST|nr:DMT family transporter [Conservatibacter flavescens]PJG84838.1 EamA family transporter [Conservatibacter flavescens]
MINKYLGSTFIFLVTLIGAFGWFMSKHAITELPSAGFMGMRFLLATLIFLPFAYPQLKQLNRPQFLRASAVGFSLVFNLFLWVMGITYSNSFGEGAFLMSLSMLIAPILSFILFKHPLARVFWFSMPIAILGLYLLATARTTHGALNFSFGSLLFLLSSLTAALYFVLNNQFAKHIPYMPLITIQFAIVGFCCTGYSLLFETWQSSISTETWAWLLASTLIATNLRYFLQTIGQKHSQIATASIMMMLEPVWTLILSIWLLDEFITLQKAVGCFLILSAILVYRLQNIFKGKAISSKK